MPHGSSSLTTLPGCVFALGRGVCYRFGFNGQEKDDEIHGATGTSLAFEYRMHDPRVGRFLSVDPLTAKYPFYSPYAFSGNRVIDMVELEGLEPAEPGCEDGDLGTGPDQCNPDGGNRLWESCGGQWNDLGPALPDVEVIRTKPQPEANGRSPFYFLRYLIPPNVDGGTTGAGHDPYVADRHNSLWPDWKIDLAWLNGFFELFSATTHTGTRTQPGDNTALRERQRVETDNTALSHETKPGQGASTVGPGPDLSSAPTQPVLQMTNANTVAIDTFYITGNGDGLYRTDTHPGGEFHKKGDTLMISIQRTNANGSVDTEEQPY